MAESPNTELRPGGPGQDVSPDQPGNESPFPEPREVKLWEPKPEMVNKPGEWLSNYGFTPGGSLEKLSIEEQFEIGIPFDEASEIAFFEAGVIPKPLVGGPFEHLYLSTSDQQARLAMLNYDPEETALQMAECLPLPEASQYY